MSRFVGMPPGPAASHVARVVRVALIGLAFLLIGVPPVRGDGGRNGGIVILPNATHASQWCKVVRAKYTFGANQDMIFQLDPSLRDVVVVAQCSNGASSLGWLSGSLLTVRASELQSLAAAGAPVVWLCVMDPRQMGYQFEFRVEQNGRITVLLH